MLIYAQGKNAVDVYDASVKQKFKDDSLIQVYCHRFLNCGDIFLEYLQFPTKKIRVKNVKPQERQIDPFAKDESRLENIVTKAVMPGYIKKGRLTREEISQAFLTHLFKKKCWGPIKKVHLKSWSLLGKQGKTKQLAVSNPLRTTALFAHFLVVILSRHQPLSRTRPVDLWSCLMPLQQFSQWESHHG